MSEPKRYRISVYEGDEYRASWFEADESPDGEYVRHEDVAALRAQVAVLRGLLIEARQLIALQSYALGNESHNIDPEPLFQKITKLLAEAGG